MKFGQRECTSIQNCTRGNQNTTYKTFIFFLFSFHSAKYTSVLDSYVSFLPPLNDAYDLY